MSAPNETDVNDKAAVRPAGLLARLDENDMFWSFRHSPMVMLAALVTLVMVASSLGAPLIAPYDPFDMASISLMDSLLPPVWIEEGSWAYPLGTDDQGRDMLSTILYGARISILVGFASVAFAMVLGIFLGLVAGYTGGWLDALLTRIADIQLSFPAILIALLIDGIARAAFGGKIGEDRAAFGVLILAIGLSFWVQYARTVRSSVFVEKHKEYVQAAQVIGLPPVLIVARHILPNVMGPVLVIATIQLALAIITEATLSFLGVGVPPTSPSLGTLIRIGNDFLFSGEWWITIFPGLALILLVLSVNLLGDWLRDILNPKLK